MEDGRHLEGQELIIDHLQWQTERQRCTDLLQQIYTEQDGCYRKGESIRRFYRSCILFGNSHGAIILKVPISKQSHCACND